MEEMTQTKEKGKWAWCPRRTNRSKNTVKDIGFLKAIFPGQSKQRT
jgi:hypothetical protein